MKIKGLLFFLALLVAPAWAASITPSITPIVKPTKTPRLPTLRLFTDKKDCAYVHPYPTDISKSAVLVKKNKRWVDVKLKGTDKGGIYMGVETKDMAPYIEKGALQFYIRGNVGGETLKGVGFRMDKDAKHKYNYADTVPLGDYCRVTTKWQLVTIPLSEFSRSGKYILVNEQAKRLQKTLNEAISNSEDELLQCRFDWSKVIELQFEHDASGDPDMEIEISNVVIIPEYKLRTVVREKEDIE